MSSRRRLSRINNTNKDDAPMMLMLDDSEEEEYDFSDDDDDGIEDCDDDDDEEEDIEDLDAFASEDERLDPSTGLFMDDDDDDDIDSADEDGMDFLVQDTDDIDAIVRSEFIRKRMELRDKVLFGGPHKDDDDHTDDEADDAVVDVNDAIQEKAKDGNDDSHVEEVKDKAVELPKKQTKPSKRAQPPALVVMKRTGLSPRKKYRQATIGDALSAAAQAGDIIPLVRLMGEPNGSAWPLFGVLNTMGAIVSQRTEFISLMCRLTAAAAAPEVGATTTAEESCQNGVHTQGSSGCTLVNGRGMVNGESGMAKRAKKPKKRARESSGVGGNVKRMRTIEHYIKVSSPS